MNKTAPFLTILLSMPMLAKGDAYEVGRRLYNEGQGSVTTAVTVGSGIAVPMHRFACRRCHGAGGRGGAEGGVQIPPIHWRALQRRYPDETTPQVEQRIRMAVREGRTPEGRGLHPLMPRYPLDESELQGLLVYMKALDKPRVAGVSDRTIHIAMPAPASISGPARVLREVIRRYFDQVNLRGGIWGRELVLDAPDSVAKPFAVLLPIAGMAPSIDNAPELFHLGATETAESSLPLLADMTRQAMLLVHWWLTTHQPETQRPVVVVDDQHAQMVRRIACLLEQAGLPPTVIDIDGNDSLPSALARQNEVTVFWFARGELLPRILPSLTDGVAPGFYSSIDLLGPWIETLKVANLSELVLSNPRGVPERGTPAYRRYRAFIEHLPDRFARHGEIVRTAYAAATLLEEGLRRAGRRLTRQRLLEQLEGLSNFPTGALPPVSLERQKNHPVQLIRMSADANTFEIVLRWQDSQKIEVLGCP